jgi:hypothetical protein
VIKKQSQVKSGSALHKTQKTTLNRSRARAVPGSLSKVLSRLTVEVRVNGEGETHTEHDLSYIDFKKDFAESSLL